MKKDHIGRTGASAGFLETAGAGKYPKPGSHRPNWKGSGRPNLDSQLRIVQGLKGIILKKVSEGREGTHRLKTLERLADNEHRRLLASIEALARLDSSPIVRVVAHQAAVVVGQGGQQQ